MVVLAVFPARAEGIGSAFVRIVARTLTSAPLHSPLDTFDHLLIRVEHPTLLNQYLHPSKFQLHRGLPSRSGESCHPPPCQCQASSRKAADAY